MIIILFFRKPYHSGVHTEPETVKMRWQLSSAFFSEGKKHCCCTPSSSRCIPGKRIISLQNEGVEHKNSTAGLLGVHHSFSGWQKALSNRQTAKPLLEQNTHTLPPQKKAAKKNDFVSKLFFLLSIAIDIFRETATWKVEYYGSPTLPFI